MPADWPELPLREWSDTCDTLHLYSQLPGKVRLALSPEEPEWQHVALYVTARGLTTGPMAYHERTLEIAFDFLSHQLFFWTSAGEIETITLEPRSVAEFWRQFRASLARLRIEVALNPKPQEVADRTPLDEDAAHASYDRAAVATFWQILTRVDAVFAKHRAAYHGRHTRVQFFWGTFDLAYVRFSGRPASPPPGVDMIMRKSMDAQEAAAGFWFGDARFGEAALYAYIYPKPDGLANVQIEPSQAYWSEELGLFILPYEQARIASSPETAMLDFLRSTYDAAGFTSAPL